MTKFKIEILEQNWLSEDYKKSDLCSHGRFKLIIGNEEILNTDSDLEWTISTSTLNLLRSIESNHLADKDFDIILHCGELLMISCPIGIYLDLEHFGNKIKISNVKKQFGVGDSEFKYYNNLEVIINKSEYAKEIIKIADKVKSFFDSEPDKEIKDEFEKQQWNNFWEEFNTLYYEAKINYK